MITANGKAIPYDIYDIAANEGWVSVGLDHDTAARRRKHPPLVTSHGPRAPPPRQASADHRRLRLP
jgi:hypothetical protein